MAKTTNGTGSDESKQDGADAPLIDLNEASLKKLISRAKKRGIITVDELNEATGEMSTDQIEDVMSALSEMGVNVVENEESDDDEPAPTEVDSDQGLDDNADGEGGTFIIEKKKETVDRTDDPVRMYLREMGPSSCSAAKARLLLPSASRPAATR
jgi:RNA polymerase primary sigma factor